MKYKVLFSIEAFRKREIAEYDMEESVGGTFKV